MATPTLDPQRAFAPLNVFISYAHEDETLKEELLKHLSALRHRGIIALWHDRIILPGADWAKQIDSHLESSQIILLLVSPDFLASDYCYDMEMTRALEKDRDHEARVIPIFLRPCDWKGMPFGHLQGLPLDAKPVTEWPNRDKAFENITHGIRMVAEHFRAQVTDIAEALTEPVTAQKTTALHQLPPPPGDFIGRAEEIDELIKEVRKKARIVGIFGMGGLGKTTLALKVADALREDYPDGQLYLDLKGTDKEPLATKEAMGHVIRSFNLTAKVPDSEGELSALYHSLLHERRMLLLMDNVASASQVEPLIPSASCLLLITSRFHFMLPGMVAIELEALKLQDAKALLLRIAPRLVEAEGTVVARLAEICGYLPLAFRAAANAIQTKRV